MKVRTRTIIPIPRDMKDVLIKNGVWGDYMARPLYQRNDYVAWILRAKRLETRQKRITQMIYELTKGGVYMGMEHSASQKK